VPESFDADDAENGRDERDQRRRPPQIARGWQLIDPLHQEFPTALQIRDVGSQLVGGAKPKSFDQIGLPLELTRRRSRPTTRRHPRKIALGEKLFFDGRLSADGMVACSACHDPARAFTDGRTTSIGIKGGISQRNAPTRRCRMSSTNYNKGVGLRDPHLDEDIRPLALRSKRSTMLSPSSHS
jgi:hypothetical protein